MNDEGDFAVAIHLGSEYENVEHRWMHDEQGKRPEYVTESKQRQISNSSS